MSAKAQEIDSEEINTAMENLVRAMNDFIDYCQGIYDTSVARNNVKCGALVNGMYDFVADFIVWEYNSKNLLSIFLSIK